MVKEHIKEIAIKKATQSLCRYKISALGFNNKGELIYKSINKSRFVGKGRGVHAEMDVMKHAGPSLKTILICRVNNCGQLRPIDPCETCLRKANELGVKIISVKDCYYYDD